MKPQRPVLLRLGQDRVGIDRHDLALVVDRAERVAGAFDLVQNADGLPLFDQERRETFDFFRLRQSWRVDG